MLPHSYAVDSLSRSQDLAAAVLSSVAPSQIASTCASIDSFLHSHSPDQSRHFFSITFPALICKLFGFDDSASPPPGKEPRSQASGWIDIATQSGDPDLDAKIFSLLSPDGTLISSIFAVDRLFLVKYVFPVERLPEWARYVISSRKDSGVLSDLFALFRGRLKEDRSKGSAYELQLNVFEYYMFWFAYYPVCRGHGENVDSALIKRGKKSRLQNWANSFPGFSSSTKGESGKKHEGNIYIRLLYAYLRVFVPILDLNDHQPCRSSILNYSPGRDDSVILRAEFLVELFVHYWLINNDFLPLSVKFCKSFGLSLPLRSVLGESPPPSGLGDVVKLFVHYLNLSSVVSIGGHEGVDNGGTPRWRGSSGFASGKAKDVLPVSPYVHTVGSLNSIIQRPLYRFILRTFLLHPLEVPIKNAAAVFSVWVCYMEPWKISLNDFMELGSILDLPGKNVRKEESQSPASGYSSLWQPYVLSNYLYYTSLVMHFTGFAHKFLHTDPELIVQMVLKVISLLTSSKELVALLKKVDNAFHSKKHAPSKSKLDGVFGYLPSIQEQLQDWEDGLCESDADGSFLHDWNKGLLLYSDVEDGGKQLFQVIRLIWSSAFVNIQLHGSALLFAGIIAITLVDLFLQLFILRAESEFQATSGDNLAEKLQLIDSLKEQVNCLFGGPAVKPIPISSELRQPHALRGELFKPRRSGSRSVVEIKYKGDWIKRPVSGDEVGWLAKLLVEMSGWLNEKLGLNQSEYSEMTSKPKWSYVDVPRDVGTVCGPAETMKVVLLAVGAWFLMLGRMMVDLMRKHGVRVNLRVLASKPVVMVLFSFVLFSILRKVFANASSSSGSWMCK